MRLYFFYLDDDTPKDKVGTMNVTISAMMYIKSPVFEVCIKFRRKHFEISAI